MFSIQLWKSFFQAKLLRIVKLFMGINLPSASNEERAVSINIEEIVECCIHKVPINLRKVKEEAYTPQIIAIGPYHHGKKQLADMEKHKRRYKKEFDKRIMITSDKWKELKNFIKNNEKKIRRCYFEPCEFQSTKFVKMILFDAIFIIELFLRCFLRDRSDFLMEKVWLEAIRRDLQLLENQLPYFVLEELYNLASPSAKKDEELFPPFRQLSCVFFLLHLSHNKPPYEEETKVKHFTDLIRRALVGTPPVETPPVPKLGATTEELPNAVKLRKSGVKFNPVLDKYLVEIKLKKRRERRRILSFSNVIELKFPRIYVYDNTENLIRNVMALEQCHYTAETYICSYIELMDFLIEDEEDVDFLVEKGIIYNFVGSNAVIADMFNKLCRQIPPSKSYYSDIFPALRGHYDNRWNHAIATLKSVYFSNPWRTTGIVAAMMLLLLALTQTVVSILQLVFG